VIFDPGSVVVEVEWIDRMFEPDEDGYAPLTNTIWTWMSIAPTAETASLTRYLLAAARRLDVAHRRFQRIRQDLDDFDESAPGPHLRLALFEIVGEVGITVVALSRAVDMALRLIEVAPITSPVPKSLTEASSTLAALRNAYEHIEDRAKGEIFGKPDSKALTIFDWTSLFQDNAITYSDRRLELSEVPLLLIDTRNFLKVAGAEARELLEAKGLPATQRLLSMDVWRKVATLRAHGFVFIHKRTGVEFSAVSRMKIDGQSGLSQAMVNPKMATTDGIHLRSAIRRP
jgi:hypothetical protein